MKITISSFKKAIEKGNLELAKNCISQIPITSELISEHKLLHFASEKGENEIVNLLIELGADVKEKDTKGEIPIIKAINNGHIHTVNTLLKYESSIKNLLTQIKPHDIEDTELLSQVDQVLNFDKNRGNDIIKIKDLFRTYNNILSNYATEDFMKSLLKSEVLTNSVKFIPHKPYTSPYIIDKTILKGLEENNSSSFLIIPIHSNEHTFSVVLRKVHEGFSVTIVNRENEPGNYRAPDEDYYGQYEEFIFYNKNANKLLDVLNGPRLSEPFTMKTLPIYKNFRKQCNENNRLNIKSRIQVKGNCFIKENESAIQFAFWSRNYSLEMIKNLRHSKITLKPKWEPSTVDIRQQYIKEKIKQKPHLKEKLEEKYSQYINDKKLRALVSPARKGDLELVKKLIEKHFDINAKDGLGNTPLIWACLHGHTEVAKEILKTKLDINATNAKGWTALHAAALVGNVELVEEIINAGADVNLKGERYDSPIYLAAKNGHLETVKALIKSNAELIDSQFLDNIAREGHLEIIREFVKAGVEPDNEIIIYAAMGGHIEIINEFKGRNIDINLMDEYDGKTALMYAAENGHIEVVKELIKLGADIEVKTGSRTTSLMLAASEGHVEIVKELLKLKADVNIKDDFNSNALILAARNSHSKVIEELIRGGVDINVTDNSKLTPFMWACKKGDISSVKKLLDVGLDVNTKGEKNKTALILAAENGYTDIVKKLIDSGADVNIKDSEGKTALIYASIKAVKENAYKKDSYIKICKELTKNGADVCIKDEFGKTAKEYTNLRELKDIFKKARPVVKEQSAKISISKTSKDVDIIM